MLSRLNKQTCWILWTLCNIRYAVGGSSGCDGGGVSEFFLLCMRSGFCMHTHKKPDRKPTVQHCYCRRQCGLSGWVSLSLKWGIMGVVVQMELNKVDFMVWVKIRERTWRSESFSSILPSSTNPSFCQSFPLNLSIRTAGYRKRKR